MASSTILSRKMIKPFSPTPPSLRHHTLSLMDYINIPQYIPIASFYSKPQNCNITQISQILENSLSKVLSFYYPFAGQIKDNNNNVDCNDIGVEYLNVRVNCPMFEILNHPYNDVANIVFPQDLPWSSTLNRSPLVVQLSHFDCGGIAISVCLSHKIVDAYSLCKFLNDWASTARDQLDFKPSDPRFDGASFFPLMEDPPAIPILFLPDSQRRVSRMFSFSSSNLEKLKDIVTKNSGVHNPTRIEVATSLVHKCGAIVSMEKLGVFKPTLLSHAMNLRPPIPLNTMGNAACRFRSIAMTEDEIKVPNFVTQLQKAKQQLRNELKDVNINQLALSTLEKSKEAVDIIKRDIFDIYICTSLCNFGLYKTDFGWGKPIRVTSMGYPTMKNFIFLDDPNGDGINVLITLTEADMSIFQNNKELLEFASPVAQSIE